LSGDTDPSKRRQFFADLSIMGAYLALAIAMTWPLAREFGRAIPGDGFDGWQNYWNLWWVKTALIDLHTNPLFTHLLFYPTGVSLLFHTLNAFNGILSLPVQLAFGLFPAYNAVVVFSFAMGGFGAYLLALQTIGTPRGRFAAVAAGVIFSFSPFHFAHLLGHMQVISLEWIPFFAVYLLRIVRAQKREGPKMKDVLLAALVLVFIGLCDLYYVLYALFFTVIVVAWAIWRAYRSRTRRGVYRTGQPIAVCPNSGPRGVNPLLKKISYVFAVWILFGLVLSPQLAPMVTEAQRANFMVPDPVQSRLLSADLAAFFTPQEYHPLWGRWAAQRGRLLAASPAEHQVFVGFTVVVLAALGLWLTWHGPEYDRVDLGPWPLALLVFFVLSLGPVLHINGRSALLPGGAELPLPYGWLAGVVPFMQITRSVSRFDVMVMLSLGVLASVGMLWLWDLGKAGRVASAAALGFILFEFLPVPYPMSPPDTPLWYDMLSKDPRGDAVLNLPMQWDRPAYLLHQTEHGKPLAAAYISRDDPRTLTERAPVLQHFRHLGPDIIEFDLPTQGVQVLADLGVRWVVLDRYQMPSGHERAYTDAAVAEIFGNQAPLYQDDRITVYEVPSSDSSKPYLILGDGWEPFDVETGTRSFRGTATLTVHSPLGGDTMLLVTPASGSALLDLPESGARYELDLHLERGDNTVTLRTTGPEQIATLTSVALKSGIREEAK
jgi:hypothetical protein